MSSRSKLLYFLDDNDIYHLYISHALNWEDQSDQCNDLSKELVRTTLIKANNQPGLAVCNICEEIDCECMRYLIGAKSLILLCSRKCHEMFPDCQEGCIPIFGNIFGLPVYCSDNILNQNYICFYNGTPRDIIRVKVDDFIRFAKPIVGSFSVKEPNQEETARLT